MSVVVTSPGLQKPEIPVRSSRLPSPDGCGTLYDTLLEAIAAREHPTR